MTRVTAVMMVNSWVWRIFWNYKIFWNYNCWNILIDDWAFQVALVVKIPPAIAGDLRDTGSIPCLERSLGGGHMENPMDRRAWWATVIPLHTVRHNWGDLACTHSFYCASLYYICVYIYIYIYIYKLKFCGNFASRKSISTIFPKVIFSLCLSVTFW